MKMKLYYVVKNTNKNEFNSDEDWEYVAGPLSFEDAWDNRNVRLDPGKFTVVEQVIEVNW